MLDHKAVLDGLAYPGSPPTLLIVEEGSIVNPGALPEDVIVVYLKPGSPPPLVVHPPIF